MLKTAGLAVVLLLVGCGGSFRRDDEPAGAGASGGGGYAQGGASAGGGNATGGAPNEACGTAVPQPSPVQFGFYSDEPVWVRQGCALEYQLSQLCGAGSVPIPGDPGLAACYILPCSDTGTCYACRPCPHSALQLTNRVVLTRTWDGLINDYGTTASGCACVDKHPAPSGRYQLVISAFLSEEDALANRNGYPHTVQFDLPAPDSVVLDLGFMGI